MEEDRTARQANPEMIGTFYVEYDIPVTVMYLCVIIMGFGNWVNFWLILKTKALRIPFNLIVLALAFSDGLSTTVIAPMELVRILMSYETTTQTWCHTKNILRTFCFSISLLITFSLAVLRFAVGLLKKPFKMTNRQVTAIIVTVYVLATISAPLPLDKNTRIHSVCMGWIDVEGARSVMLNRGWLVPDFPKPPVTFSEPNGQLDASLNESIGKSDALFTKFSSQSDASSTEFIHQSDASFTESISQSDASFTESVSQSDASFTESIGQSNSTSPKHGFMQRETDDGLSLIMTLAMTTVTYEGLNASSYIVKNTTGKVEFRTVSEVWRYYFIVTITLFCGTVFCYVSLTILIKKRLGSTSNTTITNNKVILTMRTTVYVTCAVFVSFLVPFFPAVIYLPPIVSKACLHYVSIFNCLSYLDGALRPLIYYLSNSSYRSALLKAMPEWMKRVLCCSKKIGPTDTPVIPLQVINSPPEPRRD